MYPPNDLTVFMLLIVSLINDPRLFYISSLFFDILFMTEDWIAPLAAIKGEKTSKIKVNFQENVKAKANDTVIVDKFKKITDMNPVRALWSWYESWDSLIEIAPGVFYFLSKYEQANFKIFLKTFILRVKTNFSPK